MLKKHKSRYKAKFNRLRKTLDKALKGYRQEYEHPIFFENVRTEETEVGIKRIVHIDDRKYELELKPLDDIQYDLATAMVSGTTISTKLH